MRGIFKRKSSDIWQGRFRIPEELWSQRDRLEALGANGLKKSQEFALSTGHHIKDDAEAKYRLMLTEWDMQLNAWRELLVAGPKSLTHRQQVALAASVGREFFEQHEDDPFDAPHESGIIELDASGDEALKDAVKRMPVNRVKSFAASLRKYQRDTKAGKAPSSIAFLKAYPEISHVLAKDLRDYLEEAHGEAASAILRRHNQHIDQTSRNLLNAQIARMMEIAREGLRARASGDYSPIAGFANAPEFESRSKAKASENPLFTFDAIVQAEAERRSKGKDAKPFSSRTAIKYAKNASYFVAWRKAKGLRKSAAEDASTLTRDEIELWREDLQAQGAITNRTVNERVACVSTIITWGRRLYRNMFHPQGHPLEGIEKLDFVTLDSDARTYRIDEAIQVLKASRKESEVRRRWLPWICAYSGLRISEAGHLMAEDFFQVNGQWYFRVSTSGGRSLKTVSSQRRIPVHPSLFAEGLIEFVKEVGSGKLFSSNRIQPVMSVWVRETAMVTGSELSPNHGWRHFFEDLCALANMPDAARDYMTGRATGRSRDHYGKSELMLPGLAEAMNKIPDILSLSSNDTENPIHK